MKIACIQQLARDVGEFDDAFRGLLALTAEAAENGADLVVQPEAAYPAYFLGIDPACRDKALARSNEYLAAMADLAKKHRVHIAACAAVRDRDNLYNACILLGDDGRELGRAYKSALWHFDNKWFSPGVEHRAFDTRLGRMGIMICADARLPEIARILALDGARLIIDPVNLVASAAAPAALANLQHAFMLQARAAENGVWIAVANKAGLEAQSIRYLGRSLVVDPHGRVAAEASPDREEILYCEADLHSPAPALDGRRPELYGDLTLPEHELPVAGHLALEKEDAEVFASTVQFVSESAGEYVDKALFHCRAAALMGSRLLCLPPLGAGSPLRPVVERLQARLPDGMLVAASGLLDGGVGALLFDNAAIRGEYHKTHGDGPADGHSIAVAETPLGVIGAMFDREAYVPEVARVAMLRGCGIMLWFDAGPRALNGKVAQTRAAENRMYLIRTNSCVDGDTACIVNPDGGVIASTYTGVEQSAGAMLFAPLAAAKTILPGTGVLTSRRPATYGALTEAPPS